MQKSSKIITILVCPCNPQMHYPLSMQRCPRCGRTQFYEQEVEVFERTKNYENKKFALEIAGLILGIAILFAILLSDYVHAANRDEEVTSWTYQTENEYTGVMKEQAICEYVSGNY